MDNDSQRLEERIRRSGSVLGFFGIEKVERSEEGFTAYARKATMKERFDLRLAYGGSEVPVRYQLA